jgi:ABC-type bacteriocin/lantibiotic exporter with double-glycine peptidase domain
MKWRCAAAVGLIALPLAGLDFARDLSAPALRGRSVGDAGVVRQRTAADCGLAALATLALNGTGVAPPYDGLLRSHPPPADGFTIRELARIAGTLEMTLAPAVVAPGALSTLTLPAIVHLRSRHFVVVIAREGDRWRVADPSRGMLSVSDASLRDAMSGAALARPARAAVTTSGGTQ